MENIYLERASHNGTILIADHSSNLLALGKRLRSEGYFVLTAVESKQAVAIVQNKMPDLVLVAAAIQPNNGFEVCRSIKNSDRRNIPVLVMSDTNEASVKTEAQAAGADDFIAGPLDLDRLVKCVDEFFPGKKQKVKSQKQKKALLIEDNELNKDFISMLLDGMGFDVATAVNGKEAIEKFTAGTFDIVLTDLHVPIMSGIEITKTIREQYFSKVPIILISGEMDIAVIARCFEVGINAHLPKPFQTDQFRKLIGKFMPEIETEAMVIPDTRAEKEKEGYDYSSIIDLAKGDTDLLKKWHSHFMSTITSASEYVNSSIHESNFSGGKAIFHDLNNYSAYFGTERLRTYVQELSAVRKVSDDKERLGNFYRKIKEELENIQRFYDRDNLFS